jgi:Flp pilus assembly protein CpaB
VVDDWNRNGATGFEQGDFSSPVTENAPPRKPTRKELKAAKKNNKLSAPQNVKSRPSQVSLNAQRSLRVYKIGALVFALAFVAALAYFETSPKKTFVVEAKTAISPLSPLNSNDIIAVAIPSQDVLRGTFQGKTAALAIKAATHYTNGSLTQYPIAASQQINPTYLFSSSIAKPTLGPNNRLVSVTASTATAVGGALRAGEHVDVIAVSNTTNPTGTYNTPTIVASNVEIIADSPTTSAVVTNSNATTTTAAPANGGNGVYVLDVPDSVIFGLIQGDAQEKLYLVYRAPGAQNLVQPAAPATAVNTAASPSSSGSTSPNPGSTFVP